jgi:hypothetical protein
MTEFQTDFVKFLEFPEHSCLRAVNGTTCAACETKSDLYRWMENGLEEVGYPVTYPSAEACLIPY